MGDKYRLIKVNHGSISKPIYRIQALKDFNDVKKGDLGGYVRGYHNLSQEGYCWIYDEASVLDNAKVMNDGIVRGNSIVKDNALVLYNSIVEDKAIVRGDSTICGDAVISSQEDYEVFRNTWSSGRYFTYTRSNKMWIVGCFYGNSEELIEKAYKDSKLSGDMYSLYVRLVEDMEKVRNGR